MRFSREFYFVLVLRYSSIVTLTENPKNKNQEIGNQIMRFFKYKHRGCTVHLFSTAMFTYKYKYVRA